MLLCLTGGVCVCQEVGSQQAAQNLDSMVESERLYESPAFRVSHEGLAELLAEVKRVDALISEKPPGHPVRFLTVTTTIITITR